MGKVKLNARLDAGVMERLMLLQSSQRIPIPDIIANALDALEREQKLSETLMERVDNIEDKLASLTGLFNEKMDIASFNEKERLKSLLQLLETKLQAHDQAEQARFDKIAPRTS